MSSISSPHYVYPCSTSITDQNPNNHLCKSPRFFLPISSSSSCYNYSSHMKRRISRRRRRSLVVSQRSPFSTICRCQREASSWDSLFPDVLKNAVKRWRNYVSSRQFLGSKKGPESNKDNLGGGDDDDVGRRDWDWSRWNRHFEQVQDQERILSILKAQLGDAVQREDYADACKLKVAIAAAARNDTVGRAISELNRAVKEERYQDAAFIRDHAGAGLVGWWAGVSEDSADPYGRIIHISAEHGRYVARSYSSRQLATASPGAPLFEVFFTVNDDGEYKQQAVYLKWNKGNSGDFFTKSSKSSVSGLDFSDFAGEKTNSSATIADELEVDEEKDDDGDDDDDNDNDVADELSGIQNIMRDMIPGFKLNVVKVVLPGKIDRDLIFKSLEHESEEEEDDDKSVDFESVETDEEIKAESDADEIEMGAGGGFGGSAEEQSQMAVKIVIGTLAQNFSSDASPKDIIRLPAKLERRSRVSFSLSIEKDDNKPNLAGRGQVSPGKHVTDSGQRSIDHVMSDIAKVLTSRDRNRRIPMKVLKDVGELLNLTLTQAQTRQALSGSTVFNRIEIPVTSDPLNGLYIGAHGLYSSEIIHLRRKFGQWQEDSKIEKSSDFEFYEYVEALKLTGDPYVPAGQVAFRAKVGKWNQLPHKGIIPEEFGVVARYRGQGRLAEPGFRNPRWVDGELVILDGKFIRGGPVVGFVYWAPEYNFLVFFNRLKLQD